MSASEQGLQALQLYNIKFGRVSIEDIKGPVSRDKGYLNKFTRVSSEQFYLVRV